MTQERPDLIQPARPFRIRLALALTSGFRLGLSLACRLNDKSALSWEDWACQESYPSRAKGAMRSREALDDGDEPWVAAGDDASVRA